ncbi:hypothetical protein HZC32_02840 [Candidatus Woesearchaeota archaeon]|nr:hypothetical protein [Candidatus Woesearchaeota archaeon]
MNRKGEEAFDPARKTIYWMIAGVMIVLVVLAFSGTLVGYKNKLTYYPPKLKAELISSRFANIPECFAYQDKISGRVYPGVIDLNKFTNATLYDCYHTGQEKGYEDYNFRLKLYNKSTEVLTNNYFNKDDFTLFRKVLVNNKGKSSEDMLYIFVQVNI